MTEEQCELYLNTVGVEVVKPLENVNGVTKHYKGQEAVDVFSGFFGKLVKDWENEEKEKVKK